MTMPPAERFYLVTPNFNGAAHLDETIWSVIGQVGDVELRYHVQDAGSTDGSAELLAAWDRRLKTGYFPAGCKKMQFSFSIERDSGIYDGLNRGFAHAFEDGATGWMGWINASDRLQPGALATIAARTADFPELSWLIGRPSQIDERGCPLNIGMPVAYPQRSVAAGLHDGRRFGYIQQEAVFWRTSLWQQAGGRLATDAGLAGDFALWRRFATLAAPVAVDAVLSSFRFHDGQLSAAGDRYATDVETSIGADCGVRDAAWSDWQTALRISDLGTLIEQGFCGKLLIYDWDARRWRVTNRLPVPTLRLPIVQPLGL